MAVAFNSPLFMLEDEEAQKLAAATMRVGRHYGFTMSAHTADHVAFFSCLGTIYGRRIVYVMQQRKAAREGGAMPAPAGAEHANGAAGAPSTTTLSPDQLAAAVASGQA